VTVDDVTRLCAEGSEDDCAGVANRMGASVASVTAGPWQPSKGTYVTSAHLLIIMFGLAAALSACGTTSEPERIPPPPQMREQPAPRMEFESQTDTVNAIHTEEGAQRLSGGQPQIRFMVQIGAFRDPHLASIVQNTARQRFNLPVLNDYSTQLSLYQIRIGFFETRDAALAFREQMQKRYPGDYSDSWLVQLKP
jgi:cell division septation protein DedD